MPHLKRSTTGHLTKRPSGHLRLKRYYTLYPITGVEHNFSTTYSIAGKSKVEQMEMLGQAWASYYPPAYREPSPHLYSDFDCVSASSGEPFTVFGCSHARIYEVRYIDTINQQWAPLTDGPAVCSNLKFNLSVQDDSQLVNPTTAFVGIGTHVVLPDGPPANWPVVWSSTDTSTGDHVIDRVFGFSRYVWVVQKITNVNDAYAGADPGFPLWNFSRSASGSLNTASIVWH